MSILQFNFEKPEWESVFNSIPEGGEFDAVQFLAMMEPEDDDALEEALSALDDRDILLNIDNLSPFAQSGDAAVRLRLEKELAEQGKLPQGLEENDPLRLYMEELASMPVSGHPQALAEAYRAGKEDALPRLLALMLSRVVEQAIPLAGRGVLLMDMIQEGGLGLWTAILSYEGGDFEEICCRCIQRSLHGALVLQAREYGVGQKMRQAMEDYRAMDEKLLSDLGRNPTVEELAEALHMTVAETATVAEALETVRRLNRAKQEPEPEEEELAETQAVEDTAYFQMRQRICELLSSLDETDAKLLTLRFGLDEGLPMSAAEVAKQLGMTPDEVSAREAAALAQLRNEQ